MNRTMNKPKIPTLKAIMSEYGCGIDRARTIQAMKETEVDSAYYRKTGKHFLHVVKADDLERHPELAVRDYPRRDLPKRTLDGRPEDALKTHEAHVSFLLSALEDGDPEFFAHCVGIVARANKMNGVTVTAHTPPRRRAQTRLRRERVKA